MQRSLSSPSRRGIWTRGVAGLAILGLLAGGSLAATGAFARGDDHHHDFRGDRGHGGWGGGWHRPPPVVYGSPYYAPYGTPYYPPPVVYGPGISIALPRVVIH